MDKLAEVLAAIEVIEEKVKDKEDWVAEAGARHRLGNAWPEVKALLLELQQRRKDSARLDWLEKWHKDRHGGYESIDFREVGGFAIYDFCNCIDGMGETLREAIDAAVQRDAAMKKAPDAR